MNIKNIADLKRIVGEMHDSEFEGKDFFYDAERKIFTLKSRCSSDKRKIFSLEIYNVEKYNLINLDKVNEGKALGGVFNDIRVDSTGLELKIISQDLKISLSLSKLEGKFAINRK